MINQDPTVKNVVWKRSLALNHCSASTKERKGRQTVVNAILINLKTLIKINQNWFNCECTDIPVFRCEFSILHLHNEENQIMCGYFIIILLFLFAVPVFSALSVQCCSEKANICCENSVAVSTATCFL